MIDEGKKRMMDIEKIKVIADQYGFDNQSNQLIEECAELIQAVNKLKRNNEEYYKENVIEEIADVSVMLQQVIYLLDISEDVKKVIGEKIKRQMERMHKKCYQCEWNLLNGGSCEKKEVCKMFYPINKGKNYLQEREEFFTDK